jgi:hypothetical protein
MNNEVAMEYAKAAIIWQVQAEEQIQRTDKGGLLGDMINPSQPMTMTPAAYEADE